MSTPKVRIGLFATGLETYWGQFDGLLQKLDNHRKTIHDHLSSDGRVEVVDAGMVDNPQRASEAATLFASSDVELVFLYVATYCLSSTILPVARRLRCPVVVLNVQPGAAIDYAKLNSLGDRGAMTGMWLENCQACSVPEIANVFIRAGLRYDIVTGHLGEDGVWKAVSQWTGAAYVHHMMRENRMGVLGHYYGGMLDVYTDLTLFSAVFGTHFEMLEMCEIEMCRKGISKDESESKIAEFNNKFDVSPECSDEEIERAARTSVALDKLVDARGLHSMAYYYEGQDGNGYENISTSVIAGNTLLTGRGIPVAGECEVKNAHAMKIMSLLGAGGSFSEFYAMDFNDDIVMLGHDGPAHFAIADGKVGLVPLPVYHGKPGKGLSIQMSVKHGPVTILAVCEDREGVSFVMAEGYSVEGPVLNIGNTNSRYRFACGAREFMDRWSKAGPSHHCAIGLGHIADTLVKTAFLYGIPAKVICKH